MTTKELIELLSKENPDEEVLIGYLGGGKKIDGVKSLSLTKYKYKKSSLRWFSNRCKSTGLVIYCSDYINILIQFNKNN